MGPRPPRRRGRITRDKLTPEREAAIRADLERALRAGHAVLARGGTSLDAVTAAIPILEDSPLFNAGKGAVFTHDGINELDAAIMYGPHACRGRGRRRAHDQEPDPARAAVMEKSPHVMLVGSGAEQFAATAGIEQRRSVVLPHRGALAGAAEGARQGSTSSAPSAWSRSIRPATLAAGTSTGGMTNKRYGRVGDSPIIGAGTYADEQLRGLGDRHGELFIRYTVARDICARVEYAHAPLAQAADDVVMRRARRGDGDGGMIALDDEGHWRMTFNTPGMYAASSPRTACPTSTFFR